MFLSRFLGELSMKIFKHGTDGILSSKKVGQRERDDFVSVHYIPLSWAINRLVDCRAVEIQSLPLSARRLSPRCQLSGCFLSPQPPRPQALPVSTLY